MTVRPNTRILTTWAKRATAVVGAICMLASPATAQDVETFNPDEAYGETSSHASGAIDADLAPPELRAAKPVVAPPLEPTGQAGSASDGQAAAVAGTSEFDEEFAGYDQAGPDAPIETAEDVQASTTYGEDDLIGAAEGVFGKGAEGLARMIEDLLKDQGQPNGYIIGREAGGAFIVGARYGSGTLHHKVEGERKVYWTGPSIGFDAGANAANTFVLVYNLFDTEELYERYPAGEGQAYLIGGLHASYMRKGDVVLIPIRMGAGLRLGVNAGYMKFSKKQRWLPF